MTVCSVVVSMQKMSCKVPQYLQISLLFIRECSLSKGEAEKDKEICGNMSNFSAKTVSLAQNALFRKRHQ